MRARKRLELATERVTRIKSWPGSRAEKIRLTQFMVSGVLYGLAFEVRHLDALLKLSTLIWDCVWGNTRFASPRAWVWSAILPVRSCPVNLWWMESSRLVWALANDPRYSEEFLGCWNRCERITGDGIWPVFARVIQDVGLRIIRVVEWRVLAGVS